MDSLLPAQTALIKPSIFSVYYFCASFFSCIKVSGLKMPPINESLVGESSNFSEIRLWFSIKCYLPTSCATCWLIIEYCDTILVAVGRPVSYC